MESFRDFNFDLSLTESDSSDDILTINKNKKTNIIKKPKSCIQFNCKSFNEIKKLREECYNIQNKCYVINYHMNSEVVDLNERLELLTLSKIRIPYSYNNYLGLDIDNLNFKSLIEIEKNLIELYQKSVTRISELQLLEVNSEIKKINYDCIKCLKEKIEIIMRPCQHIILCNKCVETLIKCPKCNKIISNYEKIYMPKG